MMKLTLKKKTLLFVSSFTLVLAFLVVDRAILVNQLKRPVEVAEISAKRFKEVEALANIITNFQKERGMTAGYLSSKGAKFSDKLPKQRLASDKTIKEYLALFDSENDASSAARAVFANLKDHRAKVTAFDIEFGKALGFYTSFNNGMIDEMATYFPEDMSKETFRSVNAFVTFQRFKDLLGIERAVLTSAFAKKELKGGLANKYTIILLVRKTIGKILSLG